jgi:hypothetical protein
MRILENYLSTVVSMSIIASLVSIKCWLIYEVIKFDTWIPITILQFWGISMIFQIVTFYSLSKDTSTSVDTEIDSQENNE